MQAQRHQRQVAGIRTGPAPVDLFRKARLFPSTAEAFLWVQTVVKDSVADNCGLKAGDLVIKFDDLTIGNWSFRLVSSSAKKNASSLTIIVLRLHARRHGEGWTWSKIPLKMQAAWAGNDAKLGVVMCPWPPQKADMCSLSFSHEKVHFLIGMTQKCDSRTFSLEAEAASWRDESTK
eukprot:g68908.t1